MQQQELKAKLNLEFFKKTKKIIYLDKESLGNLEKEQLFDLLKKNLAITDPHECFNIICCLNQCDDPFSLLEWIHIGLILDNAKKYKNDPEYILMHHAREAFWRHCTPPIISP